MKRIYKAFYILLAFSCCCQAKQEFEYFITRRGDKLMDGRREFRFISFNIPTLHYIEDNIPFDQTNDWRLPDDFEITDALTSIQQMGGRVARIYTLSVRKPGEDASIPRHVLGPGQFNDEAFRVLDKMLEVANKTGVRIIIPFVDNWVWWGGIQEYAGFRGKTKEQFWTDPELIADFKKTIEFVITRTNSYTGVKYKDDKAVFAWETGNELLCPHAWTHEIATYIKSLDQNHLVIDGFHTRILRSESIDDPAVDIVSSHNYYQKGTPLADELKTNRQKAKGKKPYFVGEFGFMSTADVATFLRTAIDEGICGALIWSLRFHNRDGGFYWHSEPYGGGLYKAYHWPGFGSGDPYDERNLLKLMRQMAFKIQGITPPPAPIPAPPVLLPIEDVSAISWQGSVGASSYNIEHATSRDGPWTIAGKDISDAAAPYRPLFGDRDGEIGKGYFYRVIAKNDSGASSPSNVIGPVKVSHLTLIDEMADLSLLHAYKGVTIETKDTRRAKEDMNHLKGIASSFIVYKLPKPVAACKVYAFFPDEVADFRFYGCADGNSFVPVSALRHDFYSGKGEYGYWKPVLYQLKPQTDDVTSIKIEFTNSAQISRVEIGYGGLKTMSEKQTADQLASAMRAELQNDIIPFWLKYSVDDVHGGFIGRMSNDLTIHKRAPKGLILNTRILWTFSALYRADQKSFDPAHDGPEYLALAQRAYEYLMQHFWDKEYGGAFWMLDYQGKPADDSKELYGEAFLIYALSEYFQATGDVQAINKAKELFDLVEKYCHDQTNGGYYETFSRDWKPAAASRLDESTKTGKKTMNTHLHLLEAYTNLYRCWQDEKVRQRLEELVNIFVDRIVDPKTRHFRLFFDEKWQPIGPPIASYGHDIEGSWLLCEAAEVLGNKETIDRSRTLAIEMAQAVYQEGLDTDGGLFNEGQGNRIINAEKHWWPQAEAVVGFLNAYQISKRPYFLAAVQNCWQFIEDNIVDRQYGEWLWMAATPVPAPNSQSNATIKVSEWKCPYHNSRACLEAIRRLQSIAAGGSQ